ncbi:MAG: TonB-dependent hemoglobin/transferrin/lactoferrin family receptor [Rhizobiales bacterium]|nr:TonB-dependent hemoglobin/transferrin/lactoferrin family receptor [Hyphomicrobiales bacterium]
MRSSVSWAALMAAGLAATAGTAAADTLSLDTITVLVTRTEVKAIDSLAGVTVINADQIKQIDPAKLQDIFQSVPSVIPVVNADDPGIGFNIRGLQDFGRVAVIVDGARQNFLVAQHGPQGKTYLDPALISDVEVSRGPVSNIYGSGAIGGVVSMKTKDADDVLKAGERFGVLWEGTAGTNEGPLATSTFLAARPNENIDFLFGGSLKRLFDYTDGDGDKSPNSGGDSGSVLAKATLRPSEGQEVKLGYTGQRFWFDSGTPGDPAVLDDGGTNYGNVVSTDTFTGSYKYKSPDNPLIDYELSGFWSHTTQDSVVKEQYAMCAYGSTPPCPFWDPTMDFTGPVGTTTGFDLKTYGFDTHNNAQFDALGLKNTLTLGGDYFSDDMKSTGSRPDDDAGYQMTGSGTRQAYGAFAQWLAEKDNWLDVISAVRYDGFDLKSADTDDHSQGSRFSPKLTVGLTPLAGFTFYGTYAEGYRAPTVTEAFAAGNHPGNIFQFLPNPGLKPEIGKTYEAGINLNYGNLLSQGDAFRAKFNVFRNDLTNYIGLEELSSGCTFAGPYGPLCYQYQNVARARIDGVELEGTYDAGNWFVMSSASFNRSEDLDSGDPLTDVARAKTYLSAGVRVLDRKLTIAPNWQYVEPAEGGNYEAYNLFGLTLGWQPTEDVRAALVFNNLANTMYTPFLGDTAGPGFSVKGTLSVRLGAK